MRIGIDGRELLPNRTGVGRYLAELCGHWLTSERARQHELLIYSPERHRSPAFLGPPFDDVDGGPFHHRPVPGSSGTWWEQVDLVTAARTDALDLFFSPAYSVPLRLSVPRVVTMHDVSFEAHPEWFPWREGARRRWLATRSLARADAVISVSAFTRTEILRFYDVAPERIRVVRSGITPRPVAAADSGPPVVLFVGSIFNRRHLPTLIHAFARALRSHPSAELVIVGDDRSYPRQNLAAVVEGAGVGAHTSLRSYVSDAELDALYSRARVFVFLSEYEGFGLTPLEAMSVGIPVVVGDTPVARELYGDAPLYVPVGDVRATAAALVELMGNPFVRDRHRERGNEVLKVFRWDRAADQTLDVFDRATTAQHR